MTTDTEIITQLIDNCSVATGARMAYEGSKQDEWGDTIHTIWVHFADMNDYHQKINTWLINHVKGFVCVFSGLNYIKVRRITETCEIAAPPGSSLEWPEIRWVGTP